MKVKMLFIFELIDKEMAMSLTLLLNDRSTIYRLLFQPRLLQQLAVR